MKDLSNYRENYSKHKLLEENTPNNPFELFKDWFEDSNKNSKGKEINTMTLSTIGIDGYPKGRVVLLKYFSEKGFIFFTNYRSEKGKSIDLNNKVSLTFFWEDLERQIIIKGNTERTDNDFNKEYFNLRPKESKISAHVSNEQSSIIPNREILENRYKELSSKLKDDEIEKPDYWGGYIVMPTEYEFWQGRENRLHDRISYSLENSKWHKKRLSP
jgi:pyridoxamine 5'-phosphate oxidase